MTLSFYLPLLLLRIPRRFAPGIIRLTLRAALRLLSAWLIIMHLPHIFIVKAAL